MERTDRLDRVEAGRRPVEVTRVAALVWLLVLLGAVLTVLAVVLDDQILRDSVGNNPDSARSAPDFSPVIVVLAVVITGQVLVLLAFVLGGHNWARHCLAAAFALLGVATAALLATVPPVTFTVLLAVWLVLDVVLLVLLYRPGMAERVAPARARRHRVDEPV